MIQEIDKIMQFSIGNAFTYDEIRKDIIASRGSQGGIMPFVGDELSKFAFGSKEDFLKEIFQQVSASLGEEECKKFNNCIKEGDFLDSLEKLIEIFKTRGYGESVIDKKLQEFYNSEKIDIDILSNQPVSLVPYLGNGDTVTVNFDRVLEYAYELGRINPQIVTPYDQKKLNIKLRDVSNSDKLLLKIHGDITSNSSERIFTKETFEEQYKTDSEFIKNLEKWIHNYKFLFIGIDLIKETYLVKLLEKTREQGVYHYAIIGCEDDEEQKKKLIEKLDEMNIFPLLYDIKQPGSIEIILHKLLVDTKNKEAFKRGDLDYKYSEHGLIGRESEIEQLQRFLAYEEKMRPNFRWWMIYGVNITGKSKLAYEFARTYANEWQWYMLGPEQIDEFIERQTKSDRVKKKKKNIFIILDDFDWYSGGVTKILNFVKQITRHYSRIRILFIIRDGGKSEITKIIMNKEDNPLDDDMREMLFESYFAPPREIKQLSVKNIKDVCYSFLMYRRTELGIVELDEDSKLIKEIDDELEQYINKLLGNNEGLVLLLCLKKVVSLIMSRVGIKEGYLDDKEIIIQVLRYVLTTGEGGFDNKNVDILEIANHREEQKKQGMDLLEKLDKEKQYDKEFHDELTIRERFNESFSNE